MKGYVPQGERKKILLMCDDIRTHSGIGTIAKEIVVHTAHKYNWVQVGAAINHPDAGKKFDLSQNFARNSTFSLDLDFEDNLSSKPDFDTELLGVTAVIDEMISATEN